MALESTVACHAPSPSHDLWRVFRAPPTQLEQGWLDCSHRFLVGADALLGWSNFCLPNTTQNECFSDCYEIPPRLLLSCSSGSLSRDKNTRLESKELHDMSLKARMNVMPCSGRKSAKVSICHSLLCHARRRMRPKHPQTCCKLVHLGFGACMHLFFCELSLCNGRNIRSRFLVYGDGSQQLSQEKLCWLWVQKVASSFEAVSKEMYWWAASSWQQSHDFASKTFFRLRSSTHQPGPEKPRCVAFGQGQPEINTCSKNSCYSMPNRQTIVHDTSSLFEQKMVHIRDQVIYELVMCLQLWPCQEWHVLVGSVILQVTHQHSLSTVLLIQNLGASDLTFIQWHAACHKTFFAAFSEVTVGVSPSSAVAIAASTISARDVLSIFLHPFHSANH